MRTPARVQDAVMMAILSLNKLVRKSQTGTLMGLQDAKGTRSLFSLLVHPVKGPECGCFHYIALWTEITPKGAERIGVLTSH